MRPTDAVNLWTDEECEEAARMLRRRGHHPHRPETPKAATSLAMRELVRAIVRRSHMQLDNLGVRVMPQAQLYKGAKGEPEFVYRLLLNVMEQLDDLDWVNDGYSALIRNQEMWVELSYPRLLEFHDAHVKYDKVRVSLMDNRAADDIIIHYDFDRDVWVISQNDIMEVNRLIDAGDPDPPQQYVELATVAAFALPQDEDDE